MELLKNILYQGFEIGNSLYQKLWTHLDNREKRNLKSTKYIATSKVSFYLPINFRSKLLKRFVPGTLQDISLCLIRQAQPEIILLLTTVGLLSLLGQKMAHNIIVLPVEHSY